MQTFLISQLVYDNSRYYHLLLRESGKTSFPTGLQHLSVVVDVHETKYNIIFKERKRIKKWEEIL